jgi:hypothetical protein
MPRGLKPVAAQQLRQPLGVETRDRADDVSAGGDGVHLGGGRRLVGRRVGVESGGVVGGERAGQLVEPAGRMVADEAPTSSFC